MMVMTSMWERSPDYKEFVTAALLYPIFKNPLRLCSCSAAFMAHVGPPYVGFSTKKNQGAFTVLARSYRAIS